MLHVRTEADAAAKALKAGDLAIEGGSVAITAQTPIARDPEGPFEKASIAIERDGRLRDELAASLPISSLRTWVRLRWVVLALAMGPALMLLELDRETAPPGRLFVDLCLVLYVVFEITRRTPRVPSAAAAALVAIAIRWALFATRLCGKDLPTVMWASVALSTAAAVMMLARAPSRARVVLEIESRLGISRLDGASARLPPDAPGALVAAASIAAAGLPASLLVLRKLGAGIELQTVVFVAYAIVVPIAVRRSLDRAPREPSVKEPRRLALAIGAGFVLTAALMSGAHWFFDTGSELARCTGKLDAETKRLLAIEAEQVQRSLASARSSTGLVIVTSAIAPFVEELVFRDLLMSVLVRKYGLSYGLFASALVFGIAHMGVYDVALYQTVLLGLAFGIAYAEGGIVAAFVVHAAWNVLRLA